MHVNDDRKYDCGCRLIRVYNKYTKIRDEQQQRFISIIAENKAHAHHKTNFHTMKDQLASPSKFC